MNSSIRFRYAGLVLMLAMVLGGGAGPQLWSDHVIMIAMLPALFMGLPHLFTNRLSPTAKLLAVLTFALVAVQFVPVFRTVSVGDVAVVSGWAFWSPLPQASLETGLIAISLIGFALFIARFNDTEQERMLRFVLIGFLVNLIAAAIQLSFDQRANVKDVLPFVMTAGTFANENHFSALVYMMIPLVGWFYLDRARRPILYLLFVVLVMGMLFAVGSRAGMAISSVLGILTLVWFWTYRISFAVKAAAAFVGLAALSLGLWMLGVSDPLDGDLRQVFFATTLRAIKDHWLLGSGLGTFTAVYPAYQTQDTVVHVFANHAHNDFLELILECGLPGLLLALVFLWQIIWHGGRSGLAQAGFLSIVAICLHSLLDYPLRTFAVSTPFIWLAAIILSTRRDEEREAQSRRTARIRGDQDFVALAHEEEDEFEDEGGIEPHAGAPQSVVHYRR